MHKSLGLVHAALALSAAAVIGCSSHTYAPHVAPEGGLWVANNAYDTIPEFSTNQLGTGGTVTGAQTLVTKGGDCPAGLALDASGNMWLSDCDSDSLLMYSATARNAGGTTAPTAVIVSSALMGAEDLAIDSHGNLWVACTGGENILEYSAAQLSAAGTQTPAVVITNSAQAHYHPYSIAFDKSGNAWVGDDSNGQITEYTAAQLTSSGDKTPVTTISGGGLVGAAGVAFDGSGNLWVANDGGVTVVSYTPAQLLAGGTPTPNVTLTLPNGPDPFGLAFDAQGTLWVSDQNNEVMLGLSSAQLATTSSVTPSVTLGSTLQDFFPEQPLLDPYATAKGIAASRVAGHAIVPAGTVRRLSKKHHHAS
jgi:sugar lactone lactonase YvrE